MSRAHNIRNIAIATGIILLIPLVAMIFTDEMNWGPLDFVTMGALIFGTGLTYELIARHLHHPLLRILLGFGLFFVFMLIWAEIATDGISRRLGL